MPLDRSLLSALSFFDLFSHPLTATELWRWRFDPSGEAAGLGEVIDRLEMLAAEGRVAAVGGFFCLPGREASVAVRQRRARLSIKKIRRARFAARAFGLLPSVRLVALCNSLAIENAEEGSDIDLLVVVRPGTLWLTRLALAGGLTLLGLRPTDARHADRLCLGFFVSESSLDVSRAMLAADDIYFLYWAATLLPLHDAGGVAEAFFANNPWIRASLPGWSAPRPRFPHAPEARQPKPARRAGRVLSALDRLAERLQRRLFPEAIASLLNRDTRVMVDDGMLKFHVVDRRAEFRERFAAALKKTEEAGAKAPERVLA